MSWQARRGRFVAPFVVTVAMAGCKAKGPDGQGGCEPPDCHMNPPGIEPTAAPSTEASAAPTSAPTVALTADPTAAATTQPSAAPTSTEATLPPAPPGAVVQRNASGCFVVPKVNCPPYDPKNPVTCNPPPLRRVQCPDDAPER